MTSPTAPLPDPTGCPSPCNGVCVLEPGSALCLGCLRTGEEIAGWSGFTLALKRAVLERVAERRQRRGPGARPTPPAPPQG